MALNSVKDIAKVRGVSEQRVRQLIRTGAILAVRVGANYVIDSRDALHPPRGSRPLSDRMAWALIHALSGIRDMSVSPKERSRTTHRVELLRTSAHPERLLRDWMHDLATTTSVSVDSAMIEELRNGTTLVVSGASDPRSHLQREDHLEGYVDADEARAVTQRNANGRGGSLELHIIDAERYRSIRGAPTPVGLVMVDLARAGDRRSSAVLRMLLKRHAPKSDESVRDELARSTGRAAELQREAGRSISVQRAAIERLRHDPRARTIVETRLQRTAPRMSGEATAWTREWAELLSGPLDELAARVLADDEHGHDLRSVSPLVGLLTAAERERVIAESDSQAPHR